MATRKQRTLLDKKKILKSCENLSTDLTMTQKAEKLKIPLSSLSKILKMKEILNDKSKIKRTGKRIRSRDGIYKTIDSAVEKWVALARGRGFTINAEIVMEKADEFAKIFRIKEFSANTGWLHRFKRRTGISYIKTKGEAKSADFTSAKDYIENRWPQVSLGYKPHEIFNFDEFGNFYKGASTGTLAFNDDDGKGIKMLKDRVTGGVATSMDGRKEEMVVIGKTKARCLNGIDLPVQYESNKKAWMTTNIFSNILLNWDEKLELAGEKILLVLDNATCHPQDIELKNIQLEFLPANCTSLIQPCNSGIIAALKKRYKGKLTKALVQMMDKDKISPALKISKQINMLDCILMMNASWNEISKETIINCWKKSQLILPHHKAEMGIVESVENEEEKEEVENKNDEEENESDEEESDIKLYAETIEEEVVYEICEENNLNMNDYLTNEINLDINNGTEEEEAEEEEEYEKTISDIGAQNHWHSMKKILLNRGYKNHDLLNKFEASIKKALNTDDDIFDFSMNSNTNLPELSSNNNDLLEF